MNKKLIAGLLIANLISTQMPLLAHTTPEYKAAVPPPNENCS